MYYVYLLIDPRDNKPFYVGKGKGDRLLSHEAEARLGGPSAKCKRIREIWADGLQVRRQFDSEHADEDTAYACELELIHAHDGLLNIARNGLGPRTYTFNGLMFKMMRAEGLTKARYALKLCTHFPIDSLDYPFHRRMYQAASKVVMAHFKELEYMCNHGLMR